MPKDEGSVGGSKPGRKPLDTRPSSSKSSSLAVSDDRIDPMIDPLSTDPMDYPMALFDPVTVNTHEKERKERQTVNTLNDIYKQVSRFDDIFIEPPFEIDLRAQHTMTSEPDRTYQNIKVLLSLYDWFAAAVFDVEACQLPMSEEEMATSSNAMSAAMGFTKGRLRKLQTIKNEIQEKCYVMRTFVQSKKEVAEELLKEMGVENVVHKPPSPKVASKGKGGAAGVTWRQAAASVSEALKRAKADGFFEFLETEEKFKIVLSTVERQEAKIKELMANLKSLQDSVHSTSAHNVTSDGDPASITDRKSESSKKTELKALSESNGRLLQLLKQSADLIKASKGKKKAADAELLKLIEAELLSNAPKPSTSTKSLRDDTSVHSSNDEKSTEKMKVGATDAGAKTSPIPATSRKVATITEEPKKDKKTDGKNKGKKNGGLKKK